MNLDAQPVWLEPILSNPLWRSGLIISVAILVMALLRLVVFPTLRRIVNRTDSTIDDKILDRLRPTTLLTVFLFSVQWALRDYFQHPQLDIISSGINITLLVVLWGRTLLGVGDILFDKLSKEATRFQWLQPQTVPLIKFLSKIIVVSIQAYLILSAWNISLTSWLASAGVVGIAVGFAAKDTLANLFSGIFILVDAPYTVGQYIIIDGTTRGVVTDIGMRSTRLLTRDNVEVTVPNAVIGNSKIVNESSGPSPKMRVRVTVGVAYGSDVDQVRELLADCTKDIPHVCSDPKTTVRFILMGESSLDFQVLVWISDPTFRGRVIDTLNTRIYQALGVAGIEIPFPQRDVNIKQWAQIKDNEPPAAEGKKES